ncbi:MAG: 2-hydroxychromene-2-carboxylate isomerase [Polyangiaceae bacterium]
MDCLFFFDFSSPFAYLGATQVAGVTYRTGARLLYRPFLLGGLFREIGTPDVPFFNMPPPKQRHTSADIGRWADHWRVPLVFPSRFPMTTVKALRVVLAVEEEHRGRLVDAIFHAAWAQDEDIAADATLARVASDADYDGWWLVQEAREPRLKGALRGATERAGAMGVCGAPTFVVRDPLRPQQPLLFWGQDRLGMVEKALGGWPGGALDLPDEEMARRVDAAREEELTGTHVFQRAADDQASPPRAPAPIADESTRLPAHPFAEAPTAAPEADDARTAGGQHDAGVAGWPDASGGHAEEEAEAGDLDGPTVTRTPHGLDEDGPETHRRRG